MSVQEAHWKRDHLSRVDDLFTAGTWKQYIDKSSVRGHQEDEGSLLHNLIGGQYHGVCNAYVLSPSEMINYSVSLF